MSSLRRLAARRLGLILIICTLAPAVAIGCRQSAENKSQASGPFNVLLVTLDTTRADRLGCYGYEFALTPALNRLAQNGVVFDDAFSQVPMTLPSHATVLTGLYPPEHGLRVNGLNTLDVDKQTLAEILSENGYQTGAFVASFTVNHRNGLNRGFEVYSDEMDNAYDLPEGEELNEYRSGDQVADAAIEWLDQRDKDKPFFCWAQFFDPHMPYYEHKELEGTRYAQYANQKHYNAEIAFMDMQVGKLVRYLLKEGISENTLIVVFGDHGESLGEHGEQSHSFMVYATTQHVPLIFSQPGRVPEGHRSKALVSLIDLFPTILDLVGITPPDDRNCRSIAAAVMGQEIVSQSAYSETQHPFTANRWSPQWSLTTPEWRYIRSAIPRLFDRRKDPAELNDLAPEMPEKVAELEKELKAIEAQMTIHEAQELQATADQVRRLEALGYAAATSDYKGEGDEYKMLKDMTDMLPVLNKMPQVRELMRKEQWEEAIALCRELRELSPETPTLVRSLSQALLATGQMDEALKMAEELVQIEDKDPSGFLMVGSLHARRGDMVKSVEALSEAIALQNEFEKAHQVMAVILSRRGDLAGAARHTNRDKKTNYEAVAHYDRGVVLASLDRPEEAIAAFQQALEITPFDVLAHYQLARVYEQLGDQEQAQVHLAAMTKIDPEDPRGLYRLGSFLGVQGKADEAIKYLNEYLRLQPDDVAALNNLGLVYAKQNNDAEAIEVYRKAVEIDPDDHSVRRNLALALFNQGEFDEAGEHFAEAIRIEPDDALSHRGYGIALGRAGKFAEARRQFSDAIQLNAMDHLSRYLRAGMFEAEGETAKALKDYREALDIDPEYLQAANGVAWILATAKEADLRDGQEAVRLGEYINAATGYGDARLLDTLAAAYAEVGNFDDAVSTARSALNLAQQMNSPPLVKEIEQRLALYESKRPFRSGS